MNTKDIKRALIKRKLVILFSLLYASFIFYYSPINLPIEDSALYADIGKNLLKDSCFCSNSEIRSERAPLYPISIAVSMFLFGDFFIKPLLSITAFFLIFLSFELVFEFTKNHRIGYASMMIFSILPLVLYNSMRLLLDIPFMLFVILSFLAYHRFIKKSSNQNLILLSIAVSLATLTRFMGFLLIVIILSHYSFLRFRNKDFNPKKILLFILMVALILLPWNIWRASTGIINESTIVDAAFIRKNTGHLELRLEALVDDEPLNRNVIHIDTDIPIQFVNMARIAAILLIFLTPFVSLFFFYKMYYQYKKKRLKINHTILIFWVLGFLLFHLLLPFSLDSRYLIPISLPLVIGFSMLIFENIKNNKIIAFILAAQILFSFTIIYFDSQIRWKRTQSDIFMQTGEWIKNNFEENVSIVVLGFPDRAVPYYSERKLVPREYEYPPGIILESDYSKSLSIEEYLSSSNIRKYELIMQFNDSQYYANVYDYIGS